jgi:hypothetical protein
MSFRRYPAPGSNPSIGSNGQPIPSSSTLIAGSNGGNQVPVKVNSAGDIQVDIASSALPSGAATAAKQDTGNASLASIDGKLSSPMPIQGGNSTAVKVDGSAVTQPVSGTVAVSSIPSIPAGSNAIGSVSVSNLPATQPVSGSVSVSNFPATQPVSGSVSVSNFPATQAVSGTVTANIGTTNGLALDATVANVQGSVSGGTAGTKSDLVGGVYNSSAPSLTTGQQAALQLDSSGNLKVIQPDVTASGTITSTQSVSLNLNGTGTASVQLSGAWTGSVVLEGSTDNTNWYLVPGVALTSGGVASSFSVNNLIQVNVAGFNSFRVRGNTVASGTVIVSLHGNQATGAVVISNPIPSGSNIIGSINNISGTVSLPTGAATETTVNYINQKLPAALGQNSMLGSLAVTIAYDQSAVKVRQSNDLGQFARVDYTSTNVTTSAYTQLVASTNNQYSVVEIFDSSGQTLKLAVGAAGSEVDQFLIFPGGNGRVTYTINQFSRVSIKAVSANATVGEICVNFYV